MYQHSPLIVDSQLRYGNSYQSFGYMSQFVLAPTLTFSFPCAFVLLLNVYIPCILCIFIVFFQTFLSHMHLSILLLNVTFPSVYFHRVLSNVSFPYAFVHSSAERNIPFCVLSSRRVLSNVSNHFPSL